jgi:hypothetical protein
MEPVRRVGGGRSARPGVEASADELVIGDTYEFAFSVNGDSNDAHSCSGSRLATRCLMSILATTSETYRCSLALCQ